MQEKRNHDKNIRDADITRSALDTMQREGEKRILGAEISLPRKTVGIQNYRK